VIHAVNWLDPKDLIETFATWGLILVVFVESGLIPAPLPGDSILFLAGAFSATTKAGDPHLNLAAVVLGSFVAADVIGAAIWAVGVSLLGYWLGSSIDIDKYLYPIIAVIIVLSLIPPYLEYRKHKRAQPST